MSKQDRQGVRHARDLEQKYDFSQLNGNKRTNDSEAVSRLNQALTQFAAATNARLEELNKLLASLTLGIHTDGLVYVFLGGKPVGDGISLEKQMFSISRELTNCTSSGTDTEAEKDSEFTETYAADEGYTLEGANAVITMGGDDISDRYTDGTLHIESVKGDIVITIEAIEG